MIVSAALLWQAEHDTAHLTGSRQPVAAVARGSAQRGAQQ
jgi:hypothetical protein